MNMAQGASNQGRRAHLLMCGGSDYFQHIAVCLSSVLDTNPQTEFDVVILVTRFSEKSASKLDRSLRRYANLTLRLVAFDESRLAGLPLANNYPPEIYARFWVEDYFGPKVDRVIYLDGDIVVVGSLEELLTLPMGDNVLAAVSIPGSVRPASLGYDPNFEYFNSGVLVINLQRWRAIRARELLVDAAHSLANRLNDPDQDVLNYCFHSRRIKLDYIWNAITPFFRISGNLSISQQEITRITSNPRIVHFNGISKPWQYLCRHPYKSTYMRLLAGTEWRDFRPHDYSLTNAIKRQIVNVLGERRTIAISTLMRNISSAGSRLR